MALTKNSQIDLNGNEMILDADADTSITADTDDQIDIKVGGTDTVVITGGAMALKGATPTLTIGDAGAEDTKIVCDGNAQDYYIGLDDSADDLVIGKGSAVGTTPAISVDENQKVTFTKDIEVQGDSVSGSEGGHITLRAASGGSKEFGIDVDSSNNFRIITEDDVTGDNGAVVFKISQAGIVTKPLQSYFLAYRSGNQTGFNSAGDFGAVVQYNAEVADINGDFNTSTGLFTCPVDGTYWFIASAYGSSFQQAWLAINAGSGASRASYTDFNVGGYSGDVFTGVFYVNLDANDTVGYHPYTSTSTSVTINANANHTWFKGGLLY